MEAGSRIFADRMFDQHLSDRAALVDRPVAETSNDQVEKFLAFWSFPTILSVSWSVSWPLFSAS